VWGVLLADRAALLARAAPALLPRADGIHKVRRMCV